MINLKLGLTLTKARRRRPIAFEQVSAVTWCPAAGVSWCSMWTTAENDAYALPYFFLTSAKSSIVESLHVISLSFSLQIFSFSRYSTSLWRNKMVEWYDCLSCRARMSHADRHHNFRRHGKTMERFFEFALIHKPDFSLTFLLQVKILHSCDFCGGILQIHWSISKQCGRDD